MSDEKDAKKPMPADGRDGRKGAPDGVSSTASGGASQGDSYPTPEGAGGAGDRKPFGKHGGQSTMGYHGPEQLGDEEIEDGGNQNAGSQTG